MGELNAPLSPPRDYLRGTIFPAPHKSQPLVSEGFALTRGSFFFSVLSSVLVSPPTFIFHVLALQSCWNMGDRYCKLYFMMMMMKMMIGRVVLQFHRTFAPEFPETTASSLRECFRRRNFFELADVSEMRFFSTG